MIRVTITIGFAFLFLSYTAIGQKIDSMAELKKVVSEFKDLKNIGYDYVMDATFPNGDKDRATGTVYINGDEEWYFNESRAYMLILTKHWFYKADHREKTLTIINLDKKNNKKLKESLRHDVLQNGAAITFLDSVVLKRAQIKKLFEHGDTLGLSLLFPQNELAQKIDLEYDRKNHIPIAYKMEVAYPWQRTPKGVQVIQSRISCRNFKTRINKAIYNEENFFSYKNNKLELKKYINYKLSKEM